MKTTKLKDLQYAGHFMVDSGQAIVGDPCYLNDYDPNTNDEWNLEGKIGEYSYQGISATTLANDYGVVGNGQAVAFNTGYGDGMYPVYVQLNEDGRVTKVVIDFVDEISVEE
jgi:hypothetical protein